MPIIAPIVAFAGTAAGAATIGAAGAVAGGLIASGGAKSAANTQAQAAADAQAAQQKMYDQQVALQEPFRQAGLTAQNQIMQLLGIGGDTTASNYGSLNKPFGMDQFQADPGAQFRQDQAMQALQRSAAARGNLLSGGTLKGIEQYGQGLASQEYQNAFNRYQIERSNQLNPLQSLMGAGQSATNTLTNAAGVQSQNQATNIYNAGQARASGYVGSTNALNTALGQVGSLASNYPATNAMTNYYNSIASGGYNPPSTVTPQPSSFYSAYAGLNG